MKPAKLRATAAQILASLINEQGSLASLLPRATDNNNELSIDESQAALLRELCFGTSRWYHQLDGVLQQLIDKPLRKKDTDIYCLLLCGLYQLKYLRLPDYAAINETVNACVVLKKNWAKALINGVLRQYQRILASPDQKQPENDQARYSHPAWLIDAIKIAWPQHWQHTLDAANQHPPMTLRVNTLKNSRAAFLAALADHGIAAKPGILTDSAVYLAEGRPVSSLPGFYDGMASVQDEASQLIPGLMQLTDGNRVLDACAAPGGKTCHMLEYQPALQHITALDIEPRRLSRVQDNLTRLALDTARVDLKAADGTQTDMWWDGQAFDRILLDAPCSATGIIRRQPDVKLLRKANDIPRLAALQAHLLDALWLCLKPGGVMLYATCSILPAENTDQILAFVARTADAEALPIEADWGLACAIGRQLLPQESGPDGFYFAVLRKKAMHIL